MRLGRHDGRQASRFGQRMRPWRCGERVLPTVDDTWFVLLTGAITAGKTCSSTRRRFDKVIHLRQTICVTRMSPALSAAISCSGRSAVGSVETPQVSDSGTKDAGWIRGLDRRL
jgi:hypothetical protein